jgi:hypothetical protein
MAWKPIRMIGILQWKYRRKSTKCKNIFILSRFHGRIINLLSKGEDKFERKELDENEENPRRTILTRGNTVHRILFTGHCSPGYCSPERTLLSRASSPSFSPGHTLFTGTVRRHCSQILFIKDCSSVLFIRDSSLGTVHRGLGTVHSWTLPAEDSVHPSCAPFSQGFFTRRILS